MAESFVNVTEGSGKKLHSWQRTIGANVVEDEFTLMGEQNGLATYTAASGPVSTATANSHLLELMAGASLNLYIRRVQVFQAVVATTAAIIRLQLLRLTTAGTGGGAITPRIISATSPGSGATAMTLPATPGTEGVTLYESTAILTQTVPTAGGPTLLADWDFDKLFRGPAAFVAAGAANGVCVKNVAAHAGAQVLVVVEFTEANFTAA